MQKAIFFEEAYHKGLLPEITEGYILSLISPDMSDIERKMDPFLVQMVTYSGLKSVQPYENGVKFQAQGRKMFCMLEPSNYSRKHIEPTLRSNNTSAFMPYRFHECESFFTKDNKYRVLIPTSAHECYDSFTIDFPAKGDICVLYYIFDKENIDTKVLPFIQDNFSLILKKDLRIRDDDAKTISRKLMAVVKKFKLMGL